MPKMTAGADRYSQKVYVTALQGAANALTFQRIETGYGSLERIGWVLQRLEYYFFYNTTEIATQLLLASDDLIQAAIVTSNLISEISPAMAAVVDMFELRADVRSAVGVAHYNQPFIRDFTNLAGGGKLCLPYPLYLAIDSNSIASAISAKALIHFQQVQLSDQDWVELVETTRLLS